MFIKKEFGPIVPDRAHLPKRKKERRKERKKEKTKKETTKKGKKGRKKENIKKKKDVLVLLTDIF